jgi:hypothetical protein
MAALATPVSPLAPAPARRPPHLRLVPPVARERPAPRPDDEARRLHPSVYRRRRLGVATAALALGATAWSVLPGGEAAAPPITPVPASAVVHVVAPGDTIWSIARRLQPEGDVRATVDRLVAAHGSSVLQPGDRIALAG